MALTKGENFMKVKIFGAGSIGNHLANASRAKSWDVVICDIDPDALNRTKNEIYPARYGAWDENIQLCLNADAPVGGFDIIIIGTPPDSHMELAFQALKESPKAIIVEKPFCTPDLSGADEFFKLANDQGVKVFVGYDHSIGEAAVKVKSLIEEKQLGTPETIDVEFREYWGGIFNAHPWLDGPKDTYLGFWKRGGGSLGEHSHALHLWLYFAKLTNFGKPEKVSAQLDYVNDGQVDYDKLASLNITTDQNNSGRVVQDVVTKPTRKWGRIQWENASIDWQANFAPGVDYVKYQCGEEVEEFKFSKTRPDDFILELNHIEKVMNGEVTDSPIDATLGLDAMLVINAGHKSSIEEKFVKIDHSAGYVEQAIK